MADVVVAQPAPEKPVTQDAILPHNDVKLFNRWTFEGVQVLFVCFFFYNRNIFPDLLKFVSQIWVAYVQLYLLFGSNDAITIFHFKLTRFWLYYLYNMMGVESFNVLLVFEGLM